MGRLLQVSSFQKVPLPTLCLDPQAAVVGDPQSSNWASLSGHLWSLMTKPSQSEKTESDQSRWRVMPPGQWAFPGVIPSAAFPAELFQGGQSVSVGIAPGGASQAQGTEDI